jgi:lambda repressor-like predicted transcriptional regulator
MERIIAKTLGIAPKQLWPERYDQDGRPNRHSPRYPKSDKANKDHY